MKQKRNVQLPVRFLLVQPWRRRVDGMTFNSSRTGYRAREINQDF